MKLVVSDGTVLIDGEREAALRAFSHGRELPAQEARTLENMLEWFDAAIKDIYTRVDQCPEEYIGLVIDRQYLRMVERGLITAKEQTSGERKSH